jgi:hypothetical protein
MSSRYARALTVMLAVIGVNACNNPGQQMAGIDGSGARSPIITQGPIQGFGSVIVNGQHYALTNAQISVDGTAASEADLAVGQYVTVAGSADASGGNRVADSVAFDANVEGPVQSVDAAAGTLTVLDQPITTASDTVLDLGTPGAGLDALAAGDFVRISGFVGPGGTIKATWVKRTADTGRMRIIGTVATLDPARYRFNLNGLVVDYSAATSLNGFSGGTPSNGDRVRVTGSKLLPNGTLLATEVDKLQREFREHEGDGAELEGLITRFTSASDFDVSSQPVTTTSSTAYEGGTAADLKLDVKIQVEGKVDGNGVIVASKIEIKNGSSTDL